MKNKEILILAAAALLAGCCISAAAKSRMPKKVVFEPLGMRYGDTTRTALPFAKDPTVIRLKDTYYMYYSECPYEKGKLSSALEPGQSGWHSGVAVSSDLVNWTRAGDLELRDTKGRRIWGAVAPCVKVFDGTIHIFYQRRWAEASGNNNIWHATSKDGLVFTNTCDEPIFIPRTSWCIDRSIDAEVYKLGRKMILMFATREKTGKIQILGMAEAPYGSDYCPGKWTLVSTDGPFLQPEHEWEGHCIEAPTVIKQGRFWYLFYAGAYNHERQQIGLAVSRDGRHFERISPDGLAFPAGEKGSWNHGESGHPGVFRDKDGQVYVFFQGKASKKANYLLSVCRVRFE